MGERAVCDDFMYLPGMSVLKAFIAEQTNPRGIKQSTTQTSIHGEQTRRLTINLTITSFTFLWWRYRSNKKGSSTVEYFPWWFLGTKIGCFCDAIGYKGYFEITLGEYDTLRHGRQYIVHTHHVFVFFCVFHRNFATHG